jgi:hypothetical protein
MIRALVEVSTDCGSTREAAKLDAPISSGHSGSVPAAGDCGPHLGPQGEAVLLLVLR